MDLTGDDGAIIPGALLRIADKFKSDDAERAKTLWAETEKAAFVAERPADAQRQ